MFAAQYNSGGGLAVSLAQTPNFTQSFDTQFSPSTEAGFLAELQSLTTFTAAGTNELAFMQSHANELAPLPSGVNLYGFSNPIPLGTASAVPEPSTMALLGLGTVGLFIAAWRRRR